LTDGVRAALACVVLALLGAPGGESRAEKLPPHDAVYRLPWPEGQRQTFIHAKGANPHFHKRDLHAVDIGLPEGTSVLAARAGVVDAVEDSHGRGTDEEPATFEGNFVRVRHADDSYATYAHLARQGVRVRPGERVEAGQLLGYSGASGEIERAQLHFGVSRFEKNAAGRWEEVSLPVMFTVGQPPYRFEPLTGMIATPTYGGPAERPRFAYETPRKHESRTLTAAEELAAWVRVGLLFLLAVAAMVVTSWLSLAPWRGNADQDKRGQTPSAEH
jgi:murein DD-endopeptidase MepM/ murein hydrolase activator NlpD